MRGIQSTAWQRVMSRPTMHEWRWVLIVSAAALLLSSVPYLAGHLASWPEMSFGGAAINIEDTNTYLAKMQQGVCGQWMYHLLFSSEPYHESFFPPFYVFLGHVAGWIHLSLPATYHIARLVLGLGVLLASYKFSGFFLARRVSRRIAFFLMAFSSGLGWLIVLFEQQPGPQGISPIDFWSEEAYLFFSILTFAHFSFSVLCVIGVFTGVSQYVERHRKKWLAVIGICSVLLTAVHPFLTLVVDLTLAIYALLLWQKRKQISWSYALPFGLAGLLPLPLAAYMIIDANRDPFLQSFLAQNVTPSPPPGYYLAGYGLLLLMAIPGMVQAFRRGNEQQMFLPSWLAAVVLLLYTPFALQRRVVEGVHIAICILAAEGLTTWWLPRIRRSRVARLFEVRSGYPRGRLRTLILNLVLGLSTVSNVYLVSGLAVAAATRNPLLFHTQARNKALEWLATHSDPDDTVLAGFSTGNYIPARIGHQVFVGHPIETADYQTKLENMNSLFDGNLPDEEIRSLFDRYNIAYVYFGPDERASRGWNADSTPYLIKRFQMDDVAVYEVRHD
jgi:hypothetical protein